MSTISDDIRTQINARPAQTARDPDQLGQQDFLDLMVAQVRNQDPFSPMENGEFIAQLAQFSMAEGIEEMQASLGEMTDSLKSSQMLSASALVGRNVLAPSDSVVLESGETMQGAILLDEPASSVTLNVFDAVGGLVARIDVPPADSGPSHFSWDGRDIHGSPVAPGKYSLSATAMVDGESIAVQTALQQKISSITLGAADLADVTLNLDNGTSTKLASVQQVS